MRFLRGVAGRAYPRVVGSNRDKSWVAYDTILPLLGSTRADLRLRAPRSNARRRHRCPLGRVTGQPSRSIRR